MGRGRRWAVVALAAILLGVTSFLSNISTPAQSAGQTNGLLVVRLCFSQLLNSGTIWAGLMILAGYAVRARLAAAIAGIAAGCAALAVHYALAAVTGWIPGLSWRANVSWFVFALVLGAPLGLIGSAAHRSDRWGLLARLVAPLGAVAEPLLVGFFWLPAVLPWPTRTAGAVVGLVLMLGGAVSGACIVQRWRRRAHRHLPPHPRGMATQ